MNKSTLPGLITVIDFETTGRVATAARATEIGMIALDESLNEVARYQTLIRPPIKSDPQAARTSGITDSMLKSALPFADYWPDIVPFLDGRILVAYNTGFDMQILANELAAMSREAYPPAVCAMKMAMRVFPKSMAGDHKLPTLAEHFNLHHDAHEALGDVLVTAELLKIMLAQAPHEYNEFQKAAQQLESVIRSNKPAAQPLLRSDVAKKLPSASMSNRLQTASQEVREVETLKNIAKEMISQGKPYIVLTGTPSTGKENFSKEAVQVGFEYKETAAGKTKVALLVVGVSDSGDTKKISAQKNGVPIVNDAEWQILVPILKEMRNA